MSIEIPETNEFNVMELLLSLVKSKRVARMNELCKVHELEVEVGDENRALSLKDIKELATLTMRKKRTLLRRKSDDE